MNANIFFDTNILIYAYLDSEPKKKSLAQASIADALRYGIGVVSVQVLNEFLVNARKKLVPAMTWQQAQSEMELLASGMRVVPLEVSDVWGAIRLAQENQLSYWDALIIVAAQKSKCRTILTEDLAHGCKYGAIKAVNPFFGK
ncbi:MAG: PIN domain-containing protein [Candidatus Omnitrophota bacterium]